MGKKRHPGSPENKDAGCTVENDGVQELLEAATGSFYHCVQLLSLAVVDPHPIKITTKLLAAEQQHSCPLVTCPGGCCLGRTLQWILSWLS